ncbi:MAG TPA: hypothetical protein VNH13_05850 [Candidatus Acidoferrales bacterium]|nr:hypothetical protein [Candidatus Acidoferrales bacterium]
MSWREAMLGAFLATIGRGRWWLLALAGFLVRGGILLLLPPVVIPPTPADLALISSPALLGAGLQSPTPLFVTVIVVVILGLTAVLLGSGLLGAWLDTALIEAAARDDELEGLAATGPIPINAGLTLRLVAHIPTFVAVGLGYFALGDAAYAELSSPQPGLPLVVRILLRAPLATGAIVVAWLAGEAWGGLAVRRLGRHGSLRAALVGGLRDLLRPPAVVTLVVTNLVVGLLVVALWLAAGRAFDRLWPLLVDGAPAGTLLVALGLLVATWAAGLWLLAIGLAWRSAAWTAEALRRG